MSVPATYRGDANLPQALPLPGTPVIDGQPDRIDLGAIGTILRRRRTLILGIFTACVAMALLITLVLQKQYVANADIVVDAGERAQSSVPGGDAAQLAPDSGALIETEIEQLKSRELAGKVYDSLGLKSDGLFVRQLLDPPGRLTVMLHRIGLGGTVDPVAITDPVALRDLAIDRLTNNLDVRRVGTSYVLRSSMTEIDPDLAARIANGYVKAYLADNVAGKAGANRETVALLSGRVDELRDQANTDSNAVQQFRIQNNLLSQSATALTEQEISSYNQALATARAEAAEARSRLAAARAQMSDGGSGRVGEATGSTVVSALRAQRAGVSARVADLANRYLDGHPDLVSARKQLQDIDQQIDAEVQRSLRALEARAVTADGRLASLEASLGTARVTLRGNNNALVQLGDLDRRAQASRELYESYLNRFKEVVAQSGAEQAGGRLLSAAKPPKRASSPNLPLNMALGGVLGLLLGAAAAVGLEGAYRGLTTGADVERRLGARYLGGVPLLKSVDKRKATAAATMANYPGGMFAESFRSILAALRQSSNGRMKVVAVTSALPGDGKSMMAAGLARAAGLGGERVVLVDCDVVQSRFMSDYGIEEGKPGLRELFAGTAGLEGAKHIDPVGRVAVYAITTPMELGRRLMDRGHLQMLVARLREEYDLIVLDCGPLLAIAETREIATLADYVVVVARWRKTVDTVVLTALKLLPWGTFKQAGVALNAIDIRRQARIGAGDASSFYRHYSSYYGG